MQELFLSGETEIIVDDSQIPYLQENFIFENTRLDIYNNIINDSKDLETIIIKDGMQFFGRAYIYKINKTLKMYDEGYDKTFTYISIYGVFNAYTEGKNYKRFYDNES